MKLSTALAAIASPDIETDAEFSEATEIARFLDGETDGGVLFQALYGDTLDEPVPERLLAVLRRR